MAFKKQDVPGPDWLTSELYQTFKEEILYHVFQKIKVEGVPPNLLYKSNITVIPKPNKDITRKDNWRPVYFMNIDCKNSQKYI